MRALLICVLAIFSGCSAYARNFEPRPAYPSHSQQQRNKAAERRAAQESENERIRQANALVESENAKVESEVAANAKSRGFIGVDFKHGLIGVIGGIARGELSVQDAGFMLIYLADADDDWQAFQVIGQNDVLFRSEYSPTVVWLRNYKKDGGRMTWLEGAKLRSMEQGYVIIKGTKTYGTIIGTRQAIVIEADF